jgi:hypothetical protein
MDSFDCTLLSTTPHLLSLALRGNRIPDLQRASVACYPPSLVRIDLSANQISTVDVSALSAFDRLEELDVADNPFDCTGCRLEPFFRWVNATPRLHLARAERVRCQHEAPETASKQQRLSSFSFDSTSLRWLYHCDPSGDGDGGIDAIKLPKTGATIPRHLSAPRHSAIHVVLLATSAVGLSLGGVCVSFVWRYREAVRRFGKSHCFGRHWQVRYREVSNLETLTSSGVTSLTAAEEGTCTNASFEPVDSTC